MVKSIEAAKALLEEMAFNNYHWTSDKATVQRSGGKYALAQRLENVSTFPTPGGPLGLSVGVYAIYETCGV